MLCALLAPTGCDWIWHCLLHRLARLPSLRLKPSWARSSRDPRRHLACPPARPAAPQEVQEGAAWRHSLYQHARQVQARGARDAMQRYALHCELLRCITSGTPEQLAEEASQVGATALASACLPGCVSSRCCLPPPRGPPRLCSFQLGI
jgi:hypothetical protein